MVNPWISHVKDFAHQHRLKYGDALKHPQCKASYHKISGTGGKKMFCSMCEQKKPAMKFPLSPRICINRNADPTTLPHQICKDCWFGDNGFASEEMNHECPGCAKGIPLQRIKRSRRNIRNQATRRHEADVIDLVDDD